MSVAIVVGNPKPRSRTYRAAHLVAERLTGAPPDVVLDLVEIGARLLDRDDELARAAVRQVLDSRLLVVASPTYKGTFTGLLKLFLDRIAGGALAGVTAVPLMLGGDLRHSLAPEVFLKPVLSELGASTPTRGLFLLESEFDGSPALDSWVEAARGQLPAHLLEVAGVTRPSA
jgi:FMN reductase